MPMMPSSRPKHGHQQRARQRGRGHVGEEDQAQHEQRGVFRRAEPQREGRERRRDQGEHQDAESAGDPGADRGDAERRAGAALLRHGIAVDAGHHRGGFARDAHQDRGGRAAILRAVVDAGEHHDRRWSRRARMSTGSRMLMPESGPMPGNTPTTVPTRQPRKRVPQHGRLQRDGEAEQQAVRGCPCQKPKMPVSSGVLSATLKSNQVSNVMPTL